MCHTMKQMTTCLIKITKKYHFKLFAVFNSKENNDLTYTLKGNKETVSISNPRKAQVVVIGVNGNNPSMQ